MMIENKKQTHFWQYPFFFTHVKKDVFLVRNICSIRDTCLKLFCFTTIGWNYKEEEIKSKTTIKYIFDWFPVEIGMIRVPTNTNFDFFFKYFWLKSNFLPNFQIFS